MRKPEAIVNQMIAFRGTTTYHPHNNYAHPG